MNEDRVRITYRELEASKRQVIDGSAQVLVATGGGGSGVQGSVPGPSPGHYTGGRGGTASDGATGHWGQQQQHQVTGGGGSSRQGSFPGPSPGHYTGGTGGTGSGGATGHWGQ